MRRVTYDLQPGQVWVWDATGEAFYLINLVSKHSHGRRWNALSERTGTLSSLFFRFELFNGWEKAA